MTYYELLERFKNGDLSEEEQKKVAEDIERQEAIGDYLMDKVEIPGLEDISLDRETAFDKKTADKSDEFTRKMNSYINQKFSKIGIIIGAVVLLLIFLFTNVVPNVSSLFYYNPGKDIDGSQGYDINRLGYDAAIYSEMFLPFRYYDYANVESKGYGCYDISIFQQYNYDCKINENVPKNIYGEIKRNKIKLNDPDLFRRASQNTFNIDSIPDMGVLGIYTYSDESVPLDELNDIDEYMAYVTLSNVKSYDDFMIWCEQNVIDPEWCAMCFKGNATEEKAVRFKNANYFTPLCNMGFNYSSVEDTIKYRYRNSEKEDQYPNLYIGRDSKDVEEVSVYEVAQESKESIRANISEDVTRHVVSMLRYIEDNSAFFRITGIYDDNKIEVSGGPSYLNKMFEDYYADCYNGDFSKLADNIEENGLFVYGFTIVAKKADLVKLSANEQVVNIYTEKVK